MKKRFGLFLPVLGLLFLVMTGMTAVTFFYDRTAFYVEAAVILVVLACLLLYLKNMQKDVHSFLMDMCSVLSDSERKVMMSFPIPSAITKPDGEVLWYNELFRDKVLNGGDAFGADIGKLVSIDHLAQCPPSGVNVAKGNHAFTVFYSDSREHGEEVKVFYFIDDTMLKKYTREYHMTRPSIAIILIDNYEELAQNGKESERSQIFSEIETIVEKYFQDYSSFVTKIDRDRFVAVVEKRYLDQIIEKRFELLDLVRAVNAKDKMPATLSIGLGVGASSLAESEHMARQALDMALGRGGDQAAVKNQNGYEFFGGLSKGVEKRTKVKTRIVASALIELIQTHENVVIMGHRFADMDCFGSAVGMLKAVQSFGKPVWIAIDKKRNLVAPLYDMLEQNGYGEFFMSPEDVLPLTGKKTLLIIVDTHVKHILESQDIYRACKSVVVIDHHRKMVDYIDNAVIFHHEPYASSASEMVAELLQYFGEKRRIGRLEAESLLAGIMLDTKNFVMRTGVRTFEAAAYLRKLGADTVEVRKLFASSMEEYQGRSKIVSTTELYRRCAIAGTPGSLAHIKLIAPQAADELLNINGVDASFVIFEYDGGVSISARSMGGVNVQLIMEKLKGGGHQTMAATQLTDLTFDDARQMLLEAIDSYYEKVAAKK